VAFFRALIFSVSSVSDKTTRSHDLDSLPPWAEWWRKMMCSIDGRVYVHFSKNAGWMLLAYGLFTTLPNCHLDLIG